MADIAELKVKISADPSAAHSGIDEAVSKTKEAAGEVESQSGKISSALQNAFSFSAGQLLADGLKEAWGFVQDTVKESINLASDLQEVQNVVDVTFGDAATGIEAWAKAARTEFGLTELQAKQYASTMGSMLKSMGMAEDDVYSMSTAMSELAADMASFYNLDFKTAFDKLRAGIAGEVEPLRQLGINMSVANLEAFALSKGIDKTWESMTQSEQTMLRYNYLMEATADAQGDFARTSDSYANALRTLETNWNSLLTNVGGLFLPVVTDGVVALNSLFETEESLYNKLSDIDSGFEESSAAISANQRHAEALIDTIAELENKQELTAKETLRYKGAAEALLDIYPELRQYYDESTGQFTAEANAIRDATNALAENALMKARVAANEKKLTASAEAVVAAEEAYAEASANAKKAAEDADYAYGLFNDQLTKLDGLSNALNSMFLSAGYDMPDQISAWAHQLLTDGENASQVIARIKNYIGGENPEFVKQLETEISSLHKYSAAAVQAGEASLTAASIAGEAEARLDGAKHEYDELAASITGVADASKELGGEDGGGLAGIKYSADETNIKIKELNDGFDQLREGSIGLTDVLDELEQIRLDNFNEAQKNVEGLFGSFDKVKYGRNTSAKNMQKGLESQTKYWQDYKTMLDELEADGVDSDFLASFADGSIESFEQLEALTKAKPEKVAEVVAAWKELQTAEDEATGSIAQTQLDANSEFITAAEQAKTMWLELETQITGLQEKIANVKENGTLSEESLASVSEMQTGLAEIQEAGAVLDAETWEPTADLDDQATADINAIKSKLDDLDNKHITVYIDYVESGEPDGSNAKGLGYVPYDGYISELHRGEKILSAAEVNQREVVAKKKEEQPITVNLTVNGVNSSPYAIADEVKNALELLRWQG